MADNKHIDITNLTDADIFKSQVRLPMCIIWSDDERTYSRMAQTEFDFTRWVLQGLTRSSSGKVRLIPVEHADAKEQAMDIT